MELSSAPNQLSAHHTTLGKEKSTRSLRLKLCIMAPGLDLTNLAHEVEDPSNSPFPKKTARTTQVAPSSGTAILDPSLITTEFDLLRFEAAASGQLLGVDDKEAKKNGEGSLLSSLLISSPYNNPGHYLDLEDLDAANLVFSKALTALKPVRPDYATAPYTESLNFDFVLELVRQFSENEGFEWKDKSFYVVIFRSKLQEHIDNDLLYKLDYESHREACESGGLLKYWFGKPNDERRNLATCKLLFSSDARLPRVSLSCSIFSRIHFFNLSLVKAFATN